MNLSKFDLILKNGICMISDTKGQVKAIPTQIGIRNGKIAAIQDSVPGDSSVPVLDCEGLHILPGIIDTQVHFREPGLTHKEDLETGTRAALLGGVTSIFEMPNTNPSTTTKESLFNKILAAEGRAHVNFGFYAGASGDNMDHLRDLERTPGCPGIKVFMGSSTGSLLVEEDSLLEQILLNTQKRLVVHCEDESILRERKHIALESQDVHDHPLWRNVESALRATQRLLKLARRTGRQVHVLHVSTEEEMDFLKDQKDCATVEVLPQHLTLYAPDCYDRLGTYAQQNPPIREIHHLRRLWTAIQDGTVDILGSDHAPHTREEKNRTYPQSPSGVPGVQTMLPIMLDHVNKENLSLERLIQLLCDNPRRIFGIRDKGRIALGADADLTIVDLKKERVIENKWIASRCGWTPFDGMKVKGWMRFTLLHGKVAMAEDEIITPSEGKALSFADIHHNYI